MFRIALIDDEQWFLIGLRKLIEADPRFEVAFESTDSLAALQSICELQPDVVLTDIRMPEMNGIELIQEVRRRNVPTEFIVISGFAEFSYVQQALQAGALDYQLKPFDRVMIKEMLDKLYDKLRQKQNAVDVNTYAMLRDKGSDGISLLRKQYSRAMMERIQIVLIEFASEQWSKEMFPDSDVCQVLSLQIGPQKCIYIVNSKEDITDELTSILRQTTQPFRAAFSRTGSLNQSLRQMMKEVEGTMMDAFADPQECIFLWRKAQCSYFDGMAKQIENAYQSGDRKRVRNILREIEVEFEQRKLGLADALYLWNRMKMLEDQAGFPIFPSMESLDMYELPERFADVHEMMQYMVGMVHAQDDDDVSSASRKFNELIQYIDQHYAQSLYLRELCAKFYINTSYCCVLFKRNKGMTFSQYLADVRITKACALLQQGVSVTDVCRFVGYNDYFYFNKVFKKKRGDTPAEYRKKHMAKGGDTL